MQQVKLITATGVLTLLIWTTANQLLSESIEVQVTVKPAPTGDSRMMVATDPPDQNTFRIRLRGPRRIVDQVRKGGLQGVSLPVRDLPNGVYPIDVKEQLSGHPDQFYGLRIEAVEPAVVNVVIDHLVTRMMPVHIERGALEYEVPPTVEPAEVEVEISELALAELGPAKRRISLDVAALLRHRPKGQALEIPGVRLPPEVDGVNVRLAPNTVTVYATLRERSKTATIAAVPVHVAASFEVFSRFRVETRDGSTLITRAITVRGPPEAVDRLVAGGTRATGLIFLTGELAALPEEYHELEPTFDLPAGVELAGPVAPVEFRLVPIAGAGGP